MQQDPHNIIINRNCYDAEANFNYYAYKQGRRLLRLTNKYNFIDYFLCDNPNLITKETLTLEFIIWLIDFRFDHIPSLLKVIPENQIPESVKIYAAQKDSNGCLLKWLKNPSTDVINTALKTAGQNLIHLKNPTKQQILLGLSNETDSPWLISKIHKPTVQMQIAAVTHDFDAIDYIENPCETVKIAAAKAHGLEILQKIKNPSEQIVLAAIPHTYFNDKKHFLYYIPHHPNNQMICAINHQIKLINQVLEEHKLKQEETQEKLPTDSKPSDNIKLCDELEKLKQELSFIPKDIFLTPAR